MKRVSQVNECRRQRQAKTEWSHRLREKMILRLEDHIAGCPRCQRRLMKVQRAEMALTLLLTQPLSPGLLQKANACALNMLHTEVRQTPGADRLRTLRLRPDWTSRHRRVIDAAFGAAACLAVLVLLKTGIFSSMKEIEDDGRTIMHNYYAKHLDADLMEELFEPPSEKV